MELVVARIARAHGLRGEVALDVRTDAPERRLVAGTVLRTDDDGVTVTIASVRAAQGRWFATFAEVGDRTAAEALRGRSLLIDVDASDEEDGWYPHELTGLAARRPDGTPLGTVAGIEHLPAQDAIVLLETSGARTLVPFVRQFVPVVDPTGGFVVIDPPGGLLADDVDNLDVAAPEGTAPDAAGSD